MTGIYTTRSSEARAQRSNRGLEMKGARRIQGSVVSIITPLFPRERKSNKLKRDGMIEVSDPIHPDEKQGRRRLIASTSFSSRGSCGRGRD